MSTRGGILKGREDAFGQAILDYLRGRAMHPVVVERDDGLLEPDFGLPGYFDENFRKWSPHERSAMRLVRGRVLDVGCAGRVCLHLQGRRHDVVGVDISSLAVKVCKLRGVKTAKAVSITQVDRRLGAFDTVVMMGNNLGLLGNARRGRWLLRRFHRLTTERGRVIGSVFNPFETADPDHLAYHRRNRNRGRMAGQLRLRIRYRSLATPWFDYLFVSPTEVEAIARGTGWHVADVLGDAKPGYVVVLEKDN